MLPAVFFLSVGTFTLLTLLTFVEKVVDRVKFGYGRKVIWNNKQGILAMGFPIYGENRDSGSTCIFTKFCDTGVFCFAVKL